MEYKKKLKIQDGYLGKIPYTIMYIINYIFYIVVRRIYPQVTWLKKIDAENNIRSFENCILFRNLKKLDTYMQLLFKLHYTINN